MSIFTLPATSKTCSGATDPRPTLPLVASAVRVVPPKPTLNFLSVTAIAVATSTSPLTSKLPVLPDPPDSSKPPPPSGAHPTILTPYV